MNGQYFMQLLNQLMKKNNQGIFAHDETCSRWHKETNTEEILQRGISHGAKVRPFYHRKQSE